MTKNEWIARTRPHLHPEVRGRTVALVMLMIDQLAYFSSPVTEDELMQKLVHAWDPEPDELYALLAYVLVGNLDKARNMILVQLESIAQQYVDEEREADRLKEEGR